MATVIDLASRRVVGFAMADHMRAELVKDALQMAIDRRKPAPGLIFHSDRGSQNTPRPRSAGSSTKTASSSPSPVSASAGTMPFRKAGFQPSKRSSSIASYSRRVPLPDGPSSNTSRTSTTEGTGTARWATSRRLSTRGAESTSPSVEPKRHNQPVRRNGAIPGFHSTPAGRPAITSCKVGALPD